MSVALNYQLSIFGKYSITPTPEIVTSLMTDINKATGELFLPNIINSQQIEIPSNRISTISNLAFTTQDQKFSIALMNERIDVSYNRVVSTEISINDFYSLAEKALSAIMSNANLMSNRLAVNIQMLVEIQNADQLNVLGSTLIKSADYYGDKTLCEWSTRVNSKSTISISGKDEGINTITDISTAQSIQGQKPGLLYHIDINTLPQNAGMRFDNSALRPFIDGVIPIATQIIHDVERLIASDK